MAYINGKEILFNPQISEVINGSPIEAKTEAEMNALLTADNVGNVYEYTGETATYTQGSLYRVIENSGAYSFLLWEDLTGDVISQESELSILEAELDALPENEDISTELTAQSSDLTSLEAELDALPENEELSTELTEQESGLQLLENEINNL